VGPSRGDGRGSPFAGFAGDDAARTRWPRPLQPWQVPHSVLQACGVGRPFALGGRALGFSPFGQQQRWRFGVLTYGLGAGLGTRPASRPDLPSSRPLPTSMVGPCRSSIWAMTFGRGFGNLLALLMSHLE